MKNIFLVAVTFFSVTHVFAKSSSTLKAAVVKTPAQQMCDLLQEKVDDNCAHIVCDDLIADGTFENLRSCVGAADYAESAQGACDGEATLEDLVADYNQANPSIKLKCE